jgi:hypothetical protein
MKLSDLTPKQRKIIKIIIQDGYDIGVLVNTGLSLDDANTVVELGRTKLLNKKIGATTDDIDS